MSFLKAENAIDFLDKASEITFDNAELECHPATSDEIKDCCRDIKVLGRKELRMLLTWRSKLRKFLAKKRKGEAEQRDPEINLSSDEDKADSDGEPDKKKKEDEEEEDEEEMEKRLAEMKAEELAELRRKKKKLLKERRKQRERVELKMDLPGVSIADSYDSSMFSLSTIKKQQALVDLSKGDMQMADNLMEEYDDLHLSSGEEDDEADKMSLASDLDDDDLEEVEQNKRELDTKAPKKVKFAEEEEDEGQDSGLLVELEGKDEKKERETNLWFSKGIFSEIGLEGDAELELQQTELLLNKRTSRKRKADEKEEEEEEEEEQKNAQPEEEKSAPLKGAEEESDSDSDDSSDDEKEITKMKNASEGTFGAEANDGAFQVVPVQSTSKKARILDAEGLALGCHIATSKKRTRDLIDGSFHRFASSEQQWDIPEWFLDDELKHRRKPVPVTKEMVEEFKQKWKEIDARPIKRVAEAKARKKRRMLKKMDQAKKKAEAVVNTVDSSEREKMAQLKSIYKKAGLGKEKREVTYLVSKKGAGKKVRRPAGVTGTFKVVDGRMKKDLRGMERKEQRAKGGKGKGGKGRGQAKGGRGGMKGGKGRKGR
ncbi:ftsj3 [Pungitius sinensis]